MTVRRLSALDGLRGVAILLVLAHNLDAVPRGTGVAARLLALPLDIGWIGVQLFFVLSGFLITRGLLAEQGSPTYFRSFFIRRTLRIFPLYFATLLVLLVLWPAFGSLPPGMESERQHQVWLWLFLSNWTETLGFNGGGLPHFWSLAVEEQFYLLWPFVVFRRSPRQIVRLCAFIMVASLVARTASLLAGIQPQAVYVWTVYRMDALAMGSALAALGAMPQASDWLRRHASRAPALAVACLVAGAVLTRAYPRTTFTTQTIGYTLLALVFGLAVVALVFDPRTRAAWWLRPMTSRPLMSIGRYSYAMYIFHKPLHDLIGLPLLQRGWGNEYGAGVGLAYLAIASAITYGLAWFSYHAFEKHFLGLKERLAPHVGVTA
jgi:peptidoglycan/LPS O-acetylase OafA/YrhL